MIEDVLRETAGAISGRTGAAVKLGIPRQTLESNIRSWESTGIASGLVVSLLSTRRPCRRFGECRTVGFTTTLDGL
jgi:hypothetical protein